MQEPTPNPPPTLKRGPGRPRKVPGDVTTKKAPATKRATKKGLVEKTPIGDTQTVPLKNRVGRPRKSVAAGGAATATVVEDKKDDVQVDERFNTDGQGNVEVETSIQTETSMQADAEDGYDETDMRKSTANRPKVG